MCSTTISSLYSCLKDLAQIFGVIKFRPTKFC